MYRCAGRCGGLIQQQWRGCRYALARRAVGIPGSRAAQFTQMMVRNVVGDEHGKPPHHSRYWRRVARLLGMVRSSLGMVRVSCQRQPR